MESSLPTETSFLILLFGRPYTVTMPNVADPTNIRRITSLISQRGSGTVNSAKFRISEMQRSLRRQDVKQKEILQQLAEHKGLALLTSRAN